MDTFDQVLYVTLCSCALSMIGMPDPLRLQSILQWQSPRRQLKLPDLLMMHLTENEVVSASMCCVGLVAQGQLYMAINFILRHPECLLDIVVLSLVK